MSNNQLNSSGRLRAICDGQKGDFQLRADFSIPLTGVTALIGRSGSGKSTLLRWMAGLEPALHGTLEVDGKIWQSAKMCVSPHLRDVSLVFQNSGLFPHLNVEQNLRFAYRRSPHTLSDALWRETIETLKISPLLGRATRTLSGGEKQRVAIARSLLVHPRLLLLDEPLASLDQEAKDELLPFLLKLKNQTGTSMIYVSHAAAEVTALADRVLRMENGQVSEANDLGRSIAVGRALKKPKVFSFVAHSGAGKTTFIEKLIPSLKTRGLKIGAIKHDAHRFDIDHPGKDSYRFTHAGADTMVIASTSKIAMVRQIPPTQEADLNPESLIAQHFGDMDIVLTEGYKGSSLPKFLVDRSGHPDATRLFQEAKLANLIGVICDSQLRDWYQARTHLPVFDLDSPEFVSRWIAETL